jgi:RNA polymerase sigma-70 factor (ECF subfamily)
LYLYIRGKVENPETTEDLLQDCLIKAIKSQEKLKNTHSIRSWLYKIAQGTVIDYYRKKNSQKRAFNEISNDSILTESVDMNFCQCIYPLFDKLKPQHSQLITLELEGLESQEICSKLQISKSNLKIIRHRSRKKLKELLEHTCKKCSSDNCLKCDC